MMYVSDQQDILIVDLVRHTLAQYIIRYKRNQQKIVTVRTFANSWGIL